VSGDVGARAERRRLILIAACLVVATLLAAGALYLQRTQARAQSQGGVAYGVPSDMPLAVDKSLGINADLSRYSAAAREQALASMERAGFRWLRQRFPWDTIEPQPGVYDWAVWDGIVQDAIRHNMGLIAVLDRSPRWARAEADAENPFAPPVEARDYGSFVAAFAARYGEQIDYYQIWDEPNIAPHWGAREIDPIAYASLLREGAIQVHTVDPVAVVLLAALAPNVEPGGANMSELIFLDALYQGGAGEWFEVVAAQPYPFEDAIDTPPDPARLNWQRVALLRAVMERHGDEGAAVWAVSFGTAGEEIRQSVTQARQDWPWLGPALWAAWSTADLHREYGLVDAVGQPMAGSGYETLCLVAEAPPTAWPGVYPAGHAAGRYEGDWRVARQGADIGRSGDRLAISFWGTRLDLTVRPGDYRAFLFVTVDGSPANALPRDREGRAYAVLYDPLQQERAITLAEGLVLGDHVAEIVAERGWGQWAIVGWTVSRQVPGRSTGLVGALGLVALIPLIVAGYLIWIERCALFAMWRLVLTRYRALDDRLALVITAAAALLVYVTVGTWPSLLALGLLALALLLRPETGLPVIALALPFYQLGKPLLGKLFSMVEIVTVLAALAWCLDCIVTRSDMRRFPRLTSLDWAILVLVLWSAGSIFLADHVREAAREFRTVILESGLFYALLRVMVRQRRDVWRVADAWVLGAFLVALVGIYQWAFGQNVITAEGVWRVRGFYGSPNNLALYMGRVFPLTLVVAVFSASSLRVGHIKETWRRWAYSLAATAMVAALFLTYSRGAWLLGIPAAVLFALIVPVASGLHGRRRVWALVIGLLLVAVVGAALAGGTGRLASLANPTQGTTFFRLQLWRSSWTMARDHPLFGVGLDNFLYQYRTHYVLPTAWEEFNLSHPHNLVLDFWLRLGLPGLVLLGWFLAAFFRRGWCVYRHLRLGRGDDRLLVLGLMAGMVNFWAHGLVDAAFFLVDLAFVFALMVALIQFPSDERAS
jgi:O-antigen ligase